MEYKVYIIRDLNDVTPVYVGITSGSLRTRLNKHFHDIKRSSCMNKHKKNWLSKHRDSVIIEQIDSAYNVNDLKQKEIFYIKKFRDSGINLFNLTIGGDGTYGFKHSEESILKMSGENNSMYGKKHTKEWIEDAKKRIPVNKGIKTGLPAHNRGIKPSDESIEKNRISHLGKKDSEETRIKKSLNNKSILRKIPVECLIENEWIKYDSAKDASIVLKLQRVRILDVCKGNRKSTGGLFFRYLGSDKLPIQKVKSGRKGNKISIEYNSKINIYESMLDASTKSNIPLRTLNRIVSGDIVYKYIEYKINIMK